MPNQPISLQLSTLSEQINHTSTEWVTIEDGHWDCNSIKITNSGRTADTEVLYVGEGGIAVWAIFSGKKSCAELMGQPATGALSTINEKYLTNLKKTNPVIAQIPDDTIVYSLCGFCGPSNARAGALVGCLLIPSGLVIILYARQANQNKRIYIYGGGIR